MRLIASVLFGLAGALCIAAGVVALIAPAQFVKLHNRMSGELAHPWYRSARYDPEAVRHSPELRRLYRIVGIGLVAAGALVAYFILYY